MTKHLFQVIQHIFLKNKPYDLNKNYIMYIYLIAYLYIVLMKFPQDYKKYANL